jgi:hypothetical protein
MPRLENLLPLVVRNHLEARRLRKRSYRWGYDLRTRQLDEGLRRLEAKELVRKAETEKGLDRGAIYDGYSHCLVKTLQDELGYKT